MNNKEKEVEAIVEAIRNKGFTAYEIAKKTSLTEHGINKIINGSSKNPRQSTIDELRNFLNDNVDVTQQNMTNPDLLHVNEPYEMIALENNNASKFLRLENGQYIMTMPLAEFNIQAGLLDNYQDIAYMDGLDKHSIIVDKPVKGRYIAFRVKGDSMDNDSSNAIVQNSIVTTRELQRSLWKDKLRLKDFPYWVIYTTQSRFPLLKEIIGHDVNEGVILCHSLNDAPEYTDFELSLNDVQALFYVVDVHKTVSRKLTY